MSTCSVQSARCVSDKQTHAEPFDQQDLDFNEATFAL